ncbi:MAG: hypothetical protein K2X01_03675 [Cyanobacteria bacterium]|nr:hypothetical protein [Cyanobacteriota bacterium]
MRSCHKGSFWLIVLIYLCLAPAGTIAQAQNAVKAPAKLGIVQSSVTPPGDVRAKKSKKPLGPPLKIEGVTFYYKSDADVRYYQGLTQRETTHTRPPCVADKILLAKKAYQAASLESPFSRWAVQGAPHPWIFRVKVHLANQRTTALLSPKVLLRIQIKRGPLRVDPETLITDVDYLMRMARWEPYFTQTLTLPVLGPGEEVELPSKVIELLPWTASHPNDWPAGVAAEATILPAGKPIRRELLCLPDHFIVPDEEAPKAEP